MALSGFTRGVQEFQRLGLINKAVLDVTAVDVPLVALAKNPIERQERVVRQALVLLIAFLIAPLHAKGLSMAFGKKLANQFHLASGQVGEELLRVRFHHLKDLTSFKQAVSSLYQDTLEKTTPDGLKPTQLTDTLRKTLLKDKARFSTLDWTIEGLLFASVGFIKVMFGKWLTGKQQFTGEMQLTSDKTLDTIYRLEAQKNAWSRIPGWAKKAASVVIGVGLPLLTGRGLYRAYRQPVAQNGVQRFFRGISKLMDYNYFQASKRLKHLNLPLLSDGAIVLAAISLSCGDWLASRSVREFKELFIQRNVLDLLFFAGTPLFMKAFSGSMTVDGAIEKARKTGENVQKKAKQSSRAYLGAYILNVAAVSLAVYLTNEMTKRSVQKDSVKAKKFQQWLNLGGLHRDRRLSAVTPPLRHVSRNFN